MTQATGFPTLLAYSKEMITYMQDTIQKAKTTKDAEFESIHALVKKISTFFISAAATMIFIPITVSLLFIGMLYVGPIVWLSIPVLTICAWYAAKEIVDYIDKNHPIFKFAAASTVLSGKDKNLVQVSF